MLEFWHKNVFGRNNAQFAVNVFWYTNVFSCKNVFWHKNVFGIKMFFWRYQNLFGVKIPFLA